MDTTTLRTAVKEIIDFYATLKPSHGNIHLEPVFDEQRDRLALYKR